MPTYAIERQLGRGGMATVFLARIYLVSGEPEKAIDQLEAIVAGPSYVSRDWLRIDPRFASLKRNPRFERLIASH